MSETVRGRLWSSSQAPDVGENSQVLANLGPVVIEHILSGTLLSPVDYDQSHDEWVLVLEGAAALEVRGERFDIGQGDWVLLPAHTPHRVVEARPGTSWLAVHRLSNPVSASADKGEHE